MPTSMLVVRPQECGGHSVWDRTIDPLAIRVAEIGKYGLKNIRGCDLAQVLHG